MKYTITAFFSFFYCCCIPGKMQAQPPGTDSAFFNAAIGNAIQSYHNFLTPEKGLYNGRQYIDNSFLLNEGIPYFQTNNFTEGSVVYGNVLFEKLPMLYDIVTGVVVIRDPYQLYWLQLINDRVSSFTLAGHTFIRITEDSNHNINTGFYDLLSSGNANLLEKHTKTIQEEVLAGGVKRFIVERVTFYVEKAGRYHTVNSKSDILKILKDKKKETADFIKKNKLNFRKAREYALVKTIEYYNTITSL